jgi:uncharacterized membrane protein
MKLEQVFQKNVGNLDRAARAFLVAPSAVVVALALGASSIIGIVLLVAGGIAVVTAASGRCPSYVLLGIDTRGRALLPHRP